jgi:hypothetical protein
LSIRQPWVVAAREASAQEVTIPDLRALPDSRGVELAVLAQEH